MKKLYTLVFLIINFNQILCSTASNPVTFKIGEDITFKDDKYFVNLEISNNGVKYSRTFRLPGAILDVSKNKDGQTLYSFKPYAKTVLSNIILPYTEEILDFVKESPEDPIYIKSLVKGQMSNVLTLMDEAQAEAAAEAAKVAKVASLETLAKELGVSKSDLRSMGFSNWFREKLLKGKPLAEDQRLLLRLQKAFLKKLRFPSIDTDNAIKSLTALLDINNLLTNESHRLTIKNIFDLLTEPVRKKVMTELMNESKTISINELLGNDNTAVSDSPAKTLLRLVLKNITDLGMRRILLDVAKSGHSGLFDNLLSYVLENPTSKFFIFVNGHDTLLNEDGSYQAENGKYLIGKGLEVIIRSFNSGHPLTTFLSEDLKNSVNDKIVRLPVDGYTYFGSDQHTTENFFQPLQDQL